MKLWKIVLFVLTVFVCSCVVQQPKSKIQLTHVLAVTAEGDTLKLPIDVIRPIYNYNTYPTNRYPIVPHYFYYSPHRYQPIYGSSNYNGNTINNNNNTNINNTPSTPAPRPQSGRPNPPANSSGIKSSNRN